MKIPKKLILIPVIMLSLTACTSKQESKLASLQKEAKTINKAKEEKPTTQKEIIEAFIKANSIEGDTLSPNLDNTTSLIKVDPHLNQEYKRIDEVTNKNDVKINYVEDVKINAHDNRYVVDIKKDSGGLDNEILINYDKAQDPDKIKVYSKTSKYGKNIKFQCETKDAILMPAILTETNLPKDDLDANSFKVKDKTDIDGKKVIEITGPFRDRFQEKYLEAMDYLIKGDEAKNTKDSLANGIDASYYVDPDTFKIVKIEYDNTPFYQFENDVDKGVELINKNAKDIKDKKKTKAIDKKVVKDTIKNAKTTIEVTYDIDKIIMPRISETEFINPAPAKPSATNKPAKTDDKKPKEEKKAK